MFKFLGPRSRSTYWSCTRFADKLRGTPKPRAETSEGWTAWRKTARQYSKLRYWIAEEGLDMIQNVLYLPLDIFSHIRYYVNNRWVTKTHALTASKKDIPRGEWRDVGNRFLPCLFNELVDYIEIELAWSNIAWSKEAREKFQPPFWATGFFRVRTWRSPQAGLDHLEWASELRHNDEWDKDKSHYGQLTQQAVNAREILALYDWWKNHYPQRRDPHDLSGWTALCEQRRQRRKQELGDDYDELSFMSSERTPEEAAEVRRVLDLCHQIEEEQQREDEEMMIRLIKIRRGLWT